jgi:hypothetical protein
LNGRVLRPAKVGVVKGAEWMNEWINIKTANILWV